MDGAGIPCYNGNISSVTWQSALSGKLSGYKFSYDGLNRMKDAMYGEGSSLDVNPGYFNEQVAGYDKNGNMLGIKRSGKLSEHSYGLIDNLLMAYDGNRLLAVKDKAGQSVYSNAFEFVDGADEATEYFYDASGNLIKDLNKKIVDIQYNYLNLPSRIEFENGDSIVYLYDANGTKLRTTHVIGNDTTVTDYCGNVIYENGAPKTLLVEGGYVSLDDNKYHYFIQDHQGNNRVVVDEDGKVEEVNDYYPFGGLMASFVDSVQPYKYNGKELDRKSGLNWYDYGARQYDATLGRWHVVDPMAEKFYSLSPYNYCGNEPIGRIDPDGADWIQDRFGYYLWDNKATNQESTRANWTYVGPSLSDDVSRYRILEEIDGGLYHKNTINPLASLVNMLAGEKLMVEKKRYAPVEDHMMQQGVETGAEMLAGKVVGNAVSKLISPTINTANRTVGRVFWSGNGNPAVEAAARKFATDNGLTTLEMTNAGKNMLKLTENMPWEKACPMWQRMSAQFAKGANGTVHVFQNAGGINVNSVWGKIEYPILQKKGVDIIYHVIP